MKLGSIAFRNIFRNKRRSILSASAISVAAMSIVLLYSLLGGMMADVEYNLQTYSTGAVRIRHAEFSKNERLNPIHLTVDYTDELASELIDVPGVSLMSPRINFPARIYMDGENFNAFGTGVDFSTEADFQDLGPDVVVEGRLPEMGKNEVLLGVSLADKVGVGVGGKITILSSTAARGTNAITFRVTGLATYGMSALNSTTMLAPLDRVQYFLRMPGQVQEVLMKLDEDVESAGPAAYIKENLAADHNLEVIDWKEDSTTYSWIQLATTIYDIFALFFFVLGSSVILNTTIMVIFERMREIGTMSAIGMSGKNLVRLFFLEAVFISVAGAFIGVVLGILFTQILNRVGIDFSSAMEGVDFEVSSIIRPELSIKSTVVVFFYSIIVASITAIIPARRASRIEPVDALRAV